MSPVAVQPGVKKEKDISVRRMRSSTDSELLSTPQSTVPTFNYVDMDLEGAPHYKTRLYTLFGLIEKELDMMHEENTALRAKIAALTGTDPPSVVQHEPFSNINDGNKGSGRRAIQMGQKLRTALRGPPGRLVFKVGADGSRFRVGRRFEGHRDGIWHVAADASKGIFASASADQTARIWSLETGICLATYLSHTGSVNCVSFSPNNDSSQGDVLMATASGDESAHIWKAPIAASHGSSDDDEDDKDKDHNDAEAEKGSMKTCGVRVNNPIMRLTGHNGVVVGCEWLAGGSQLITASWDRTANIYDVERGEILNILNGHEQELNHCSAHPSQKLVVTSSKDSTFRLWDFRESIQSVAVFQGHQESVTSVTFTPSDRIVSGSDDRTVKVWDLRNMRSAMTTMRLSSAANRLSVSKSHGVVAVPLDNRHVRIYDLSGNRLPRVPNRRCHSRMVSCVAWVDDHPHHNLLTCGFDREIVAWKVALTKDS